MAFEHGTPNSRLMEYQQSSQLPIHMNPMTNQLGVMHKIPDDALQLTNEQKIWAETYTSPSGQAQASGGTANPPSTSSGGILQSLVGGASNLIGQTVSFLDNNPQAQSLLEQGKQRVWKWGKDQLKQQLGVGVQNPSVYGINIDTTQPQKGIISTAQTQLAVRQQPISSAPYVNVDLSAGGIGTGGALDMGTAVVYWLIPKNNQLDKSGAQWAYIRYGNNLAGQGYAVAKSVDGTDRILKVTEKRDGGISLSTTSGGIKEIIPFIAIGLGAYVVWQTLSKDKTPLAGLGAAHTSRRRKPSSRKPRPSSNRMSRGSRRSTSRRMDSVRSSSSPSRPKRRRMSQSRPNQPKMMTQGSSSTRRSRPSRPRLSRSQ